VAIHYADVNLVRLPDEMNFQTAASLGCRFATSFRAIVDQGRVAAGQWVVVHGCGGVGLSAIMIAHALGAKVVAVDIADEKMALASELGAVATVNATVTGVADAIRDLTDGGAHVSVDAIGNAEVCFHSIDSLRKRGRHIQIGLMVGEHSMPAVPMAKVLANELEIVGSHGMQAHRYADMLAMITAGDLSPEKLIGKTINLEESIAVLTSMHEFSNTGVTTITEF
jgi:alcohol dehydrogenase